MQQMIKGAFFRHRVSMRSATDRPGNAAGRFGMPTVIR
jgi:hypothetical protein